VNYQTLLAGGVLSISLASAAQLDEAAERGRYLVSAAGCESCHTDRDKEGASLAGGRALETPFGVFYTPNITPDRDSGIGHWGPEDLARALREGISPSGTGYYPSFPYTSYSGLSDADVADIWSYLQTVEPVSKVNRPHILPWYLEFRPLIRAWKLLNFDPAKPPRISPREPPVERGAYLVQHVVHCGECHTPRNRLGGLESEHSLAGNPNGPEGDEVPNITPDREHGTGRWSVGDIEYYLDSGMKPDGDFVGGAMGEVIDYSTSAMTAADRSAIAQYLKTLPAAP
jgi:mono/diheme cytochrome c family protein